MHVLVAGSHGQVGQYVTRLLAESDHDVRGMVRDETQKSDIEELGAEPVVADLTEDVTRAVEGCDAIVFAAGSGGEDVWDVDRDGAINIVEAAEERGADQLSAEFHERRLARGESRGAPRVSADESRGRRTPPRERPDVHHRPSGVADRRGGNRSDSDRRGPRQGGDEIPREDVARILVTTTPMESTYGRTFEVLAGDEPIEAALENPLNDE